MSLPSPQGATFPRDLGENDIQMKDLILCGDVVAQQDDVENFQKTLQSRSLSPGFFHAVTQAAD